MTTATSRLFPAATAQPQQDDASIFERQRAVVSAHQSTITTIQPGLKVTARIRGKHVGVLLRIDDPRAWANSLRFPDTDEKNPPAQEDVTAHVAKCIGEGLMLGKVPVAWYFGAVLWDSAEGLAEAVDPTPNTQIFAARPNILKQLGVYAEEDMRQVRHARDFEILITQTRRGLVGLAYDPRTRIYTLTTQDGGSWQAAGKRAAIKVEIINLYDATEAEGDGAGRKAA